MDKIGAPLILTAHTERSAERDQEDSEFIPVIIKRTDEGARHPDDILEKAITEGMEQIQRPFLSLALSSVAAALILSFSVMAVAVMSTLMIDLQQPLLVRWQWLWSTRWASLSVL